ncbi:hypothetical protein D1007_33258 [Hordeum vulgare]|nr:hypothetical protein D1007_33258 [Hordeum vulgare]
MAAEAVVVAVGSYLFGAASAAGGFLYAIRAYKNYRAMYEKEKICSVCGKEVKIMLSEEHIEEHRADQARGKDDGPIHVSDGAISAGAVSFLE